MIIPEQFFSEIDTLKERVLSAEEERRFIEASSEHLSPIILTALNTGMRRGEILSLKWSSVDLAKRVIKVEKAKSGKVRFIPINDDLHEELMRLKRENEKGEFIFPFKSVRTAFENACRRAGLKIRFHDFRHTFATRLIEEGVDIVTVQSLLGHYSVLLTQRYTHSCDERKRMAVELLNQKTKERAKKKVKLAHLRHTEKEEQLEKLPISSFSVN